MREIIRDKPFYDESGGGVTLSGGEPTYQPAFSLEILKASKHSGINTAIETNGYCTARIIDQFITWTDLFLFDLKIMDNEKSKSIIGADNRTILENLYRIDEAGKSVIIRVPLIPGYTDSIENLKSIKDVALELSNLEAVHILPFHQYGKHKYKSIGRQYALSNVKTYNESQINNITSSIMDAAFNVKVLG
jgi:pyruvate formate lyase activating enzyme